MSSPDDEARRLAHEFTGCDEPNGARPGHWHDCNRLTALITRVRNETLEAAAKACEDAFDYDEGYRAADAVRALKKGEAMAETYLVDCECATCARVSASGGTPIETRWRQRAERAERALVVAREAMGEGSV